MKGLQTIVKNVITIGVLLAVITLVIDTYLSMGDHLRLTPPGLTQHMLNHSQTHK